MKLIMEIRFNPWPRSVVAILILAVGTSVAHAQVTAVDFGGDYNNSNDNADSTLTYENGDFDGEADATDRRGFIAIGTLFRSINDTNSVGNNNVINAGYQSTYLDSTVGDPLIGIYRFLGSGTTDYLQAGNGATNIDNYPLTMTFTPNVTKANFLNGADSNASANAFDNAAASVTATFLSSGGSYTVRALVQSGSSWYISDTSAVGSSSLSINGSTETWYPYDPDTTMYISSGTLTGGVQGSTLADIQAFGVVAQADTAAGQLSNTPYFRLQAMSASMVQTALPSAPSNPVQVLNSDQFYNSTAASVITNSFDVVSDPNGKLVVTVGSESSIPISSVTYGGVALTEAANSNPNIIAAIYYLDDPTAGIADLVVTFSNDRRSRIGALSLGNAADGVSVTGDVVAATTTSLSVDLTTIAKDTVVIAAFTQNNQANGTTTQPYPAEQRISHGDSGSSFTSTGYVQVPVASGPTAYVWEIATEEGCDAVLAGFASAGEIVEIVFPPTTPVQVRNTTTQFEEDNSDNIHILEDFVVVDAADSKLVVAVGGESISDTTSVTYGGIALTLAASINSQDTSIWYLDDPVAGSADIVVTLTNSGKSRIVALSLGNAADGIGSEAVLRNAGTTQLDIDLATVAPNTLLLGAFVNNGSGISSTPFDSGETVASGSSGSSTMHVGYITEVDIVDPAATYSWVNAGPNRCSAVLVGISPVGEVAPLGDLSFFDKPVVTITPTIDGIRTLGEWGDAFPIPMIWPELGILPNIGGIKFSNDDGSGNTITAADASEADISAVISFKWDATNLYILAEITDDVFIKPFPGGAGFPDDHLLLGIDPDTTDGAGTVFLTEFFIDSDDVTQAFFRTDLAAADPALNNFTNHTFVGAEVAGGYIIEFALNWADLGVASPVITDIIGVSMLLVDNDIDDGQRDMFLRSSGFENTQSIVTPSNYHQATLAGPFHSFANFINKFDVGALDQPSEDPDFDGVDNFTEYALGGNPSVSDATSFRAVSEFAIQGESDVFAFSYNRRIGASALGLNYNVKGNTDLSDPTWSTSGITEAEVVLLDDEFEAVTVTTSIDPDAKFLRLEIN